MKEKIIQFLLAEMEKIKELYGENKTYKLYKKILNDAQTNDNK